MTPRAAPGGLRLPRAPRLNVDKPRLSALTSLSMARPKATDGRTHWFRLVDTALRAKGHGDLPGWLAQHAPGRTLRDLASELTAASGVHVNKDTAARFLAATQQETTP